MAEKPDNGETVAHERAKGDAMVDKLEGDVAKKMLKGGVRNDPTTYMGKKPKSSNSVFQKIRNGETKIDTPSRASVGTAVDNVSRSVGKSKRMRRINK